MTSTPNIVLKNLNPDMLPADVQMDPAAQEKFLQMVFGAAEFTPGKALKQLGISPSAFQIALAQSPTFREHFEAGRAIDILDLEHGLRKRAKAELESDEGSSKIAIEIFELLRPAASVPPRNPYGRAGRPKQQQLAAEPIEDEKQADPTENNIDDEDDPLKRAMEEMD